MTMKRTDELLARAGFAFVARDSETGEIDSAAPDDVLADEWIADRVRSGCIVAPLIEYADVKPMPCAMDAHELDWLLDTKAAAE
jgi:hypothetical protein